MDMNNVIKEFVVKEKIPIFGIANADGFKHALPEWHPKKLMPRSRSVLIFGLPFVKYELSVNEKTYISNDSWWIANEPVYRSIAMWRGGFVNLLNDFGFSAANFGGFGLSSEPTFSYRLAQYEAGIGIYGRFGVCINPEYGCYYYVGVLITDVKLEPSDKNRLNGFYPCKECRLCADVCPVKAIDASKNPAKGYNRDRCIKFIMKIKQRYNDNVKVCARCFTVCPWEKSINHTNICSKI